MEITRANWFKRHRHKFGLIAVGHTAKKIEEYLVDWLLYGIVVTYATVHWGSFYGSLIAFAIMTPVTALMCLGYIRFYDWAGKDWLGLEALKELREEQLHGGRLGRIVYRIARHGGLAAFIALSVYGDAFMTTVYLRHGSHSYSGMKRRDHLVFWSSLILSNAYWTLRWTVILQIVMWIGVYFGFVTS